MTTTNLTRVARVLRVHLAPSESLLASGPDKFDIVRDAPTAERPGLMGGRVASVSRASDELVSVVVVVVVSCPETERGLMSRTTHGLSDGVLEERLVVLAEEDVLYESEVPSDGFAFANSAGGGEAHGVTSSGLEGDGTVSHARRRGVSRLSCLSRIRDVRGFAIGRHPWDSIMLSSPNEVVVLSCRTRDHGLKCLWGYYGGPPVRLGGA
jgi:hypothetical protein